MVDMRLQTTLVAVDLMRMPGALLVEATSQLAAGGKGHVIGVTPSTANVCVTIMNNQESMMLELVNNKLVDKKMVGRNVWQIEDSWDSSYLDRHLSYCQDVVSALGPLLAFNAKAIVLEPDQTVVMIVPIGELTFLRGLHEKLMYSEMGARQILKTVRTSNLFRAPELGKVSVTNPEFIDRLMVNNGIKVEIASLQ